MRLGVQVSITGKLSNAIDRAIFLGCQSMQIFSRNPRSWKVKPLDSGIVEDFKRKRKIAGIKPLVVHIPYTVNLASPEDGLYQRSIQTYIEDIERAEKLEADYFVTHCGSHKGGGEEQALRRFTSGLNTVFKKINPKLKILLENTAGCGYNLGYNFKHLQKIISNIEKQGSIGICLDTAHAYAAGFNIASEEGLGRLLDNINKLVGLQRLKIVHLNDTKSRLNFRIDRHQHIGKGKIGLKGLILIVNHPRLRNLPFILETPKMNLRDDMKNLKRVRNLIAGF